MNFWRLQCFVALAEERHFGKAASRLFVSQPALSQQIIRLEQDLGYQLVDRGRPVTLTRVGEALYPRAIEILGLVATAVLDLPATAGELDEGTSGSCQLAASVTCGAESAHVVGPLNR